MLIGKDISLANIHPRQMYSFIQEEEYIAALIYYADVVDIRFILREISKFISRLGLSMSEDGLFMKYGPMGYTQVTQRLVSSPMYDSRGRVVEGE